MKTGFYIFQTFNISEIIYYKNGYVFFEKNNIDKYDFQFNLKNRYIPHISTNNFNIAIIDDLLNFDDNIDFLQLDIKNNSIIVKTIYDKINNDMLIYKN
jgi:hypothetical protein